jgi:hypothetical protein
MSPQKIANLKILGALSAMGIFAGVVFYEIRAISHHHERGNMVWFYDESEKQLYPMPVTTMPPDKGIGGERRRLPCHCRGVHRIQT